MNKLLLLATVSILFAISACKLTQEGRIMLDPSELTTIKDSLPNNQESAPKAAWANVVSNPLNAAVTSNVALAMFNGNTPYVAYADGVGVSFKLAVKACSGGATCTAWTTVGTNISTNQAYDIGMDVYNNAGTANPYVVYRELVTMNPLTFKPVVKMYNGSSWSDVGNISSLLRSTVPFDWYPQIAVFDNSGVAVPYVVAKNKVMYYNGYNWAYFGLSVPGPVVGYPKISIYNDGGAAVPYIAYHDTYATPNYDQATVVKYNNLTNSWDFVGPRGFSFDGIQSDTVGNISFYLTAAGTPYAFYKNNGTGAGVVKKFDGVSWVNVANTPVNTFTAYEAVAVDESNSDVYVAYRDGSSNDKITVKKSVGGTANWALVGTAGSASSGSANYIGIRIDTTNHAPIVSYEDHTLSGIYVKKYQ